MGDDNNAFDDFLVKIRNIIFLGIFAVIIVVTIGKAIIGAITGG